MRERRVLITNGLGLHARAAAKLVRSACGFASEITLITADNGERANAKDILGILHLAAVVGTEMIVRTEGPDEEAAISAIALLFTDGFGEK